MFSISKRPTIQEVHDLYRSEKATPSQVFQFFLNRSREIDKQIHAVQNFTPEIGAAQAEKCDKILESDEFENFDSILVKYPLFGIPYSLKAIIQAEDEQFTASSKILDGYFSAYSSTVYKNVVDSGAVLIAVNHMDEFAMGGSGEHCAYGPTKNPHDTSRVPGGSSSGPAAAVSSGQVVFSLGTDTGGSIRQPAAFCGVVGLKPTYGSVSRYGVMPMASSFDQVGPFAQNARDAQLVFSVIAGKDEMDQTTIDSKTVVENIKSNLVKKEGREQKTITETKSKLKIGIPKEFYAEGLDSRIKDAMLELESKLAKIGHELVQVSLPLVKHAIPVYYMTMGVEVASNLERFDGVRYRGSHESDPKENMYFDYRSKHFGAEAQRRILLGTYASSAGYYDAYYNQASRVKELTRRSFEEVFKEVDVLLTPTSPEFAFKLGDKTSDPMAMYLSDIYTAVANPIRIPGLVIPIGVFEVEGDEGENVKLPTGCQILGPELSEDTIFKLGEDIESVISSSK